MRTPLVGKYRHEMQFSTQRLHDLPERADEDVAASPEVAGIDPAAALSTDPHGRLRTGRAALRRANERGKIART